MNAQRLRRRVRVLLILFGLGLLASGITALPLQWEVDVLRRIFVDDVLGIAHVIPGLSDWIAYVHRGLTEMYRAYPFIAYGTDWLAFAHVVIAIAFLGPIRDPVRNVWVIEFGMIACLLVIPFAVSLGPMRGIPLGWQILDMSFGVIGLAPLWWARRMVYQMMRIA